MSSKEEQLLALLVKSCKFIVANLSAIEKEMYLFALQGNTAACVRACKTLTTVADVLADYEGGTEGYVERTYPDAFVAKVTDERMLALVKRMDAVLALVRSKIVPLIVSIKSGSFDPKVSSDVIKVNNVLKTYIASLTTQK